MQMAGWQNRLHLSLLGENVLFGSLQLDSLLSFLVASILTVSFCVSERMLTLALSKHWNPFPFIQRSRLRIALWRSALYWLVTLNRLIYMLIAMTYNLGLILLTVTALSAGQFIIEYIDTPAQPSSNSFYLSHPSQHFDQTKEGLLDSPYSEYNDLSSIPLTRSNLQLRSSPTSSYYHHGSLEHSPPPPPPPSPPSPPPPASTMTPRPRSKSRPDQLFIHPVQSNIVRAEAFAIQYGYSSTNTELIDASSCIYPASTGADNSTASRGWGGDKGREAARELLGAVHNHNSDATFRIGDDDE